jgi:hypothetical protein
MVMDMGRDAVPETVEMVFRPTAEDFSSALRARLRVSRSGRRQLWSFGVIGVCAVFLAVMEVAGPGGVSPFFWVGVALAVFLAVGAPWLQARQFQRLAEPNGTFRASVTDTGVAVATDNTTATVNWAAQPRYRETSRAFVLFSADANACGFTVLPKRGLQDPADADRLRAILDRHLARV